MLGKSHRRLISRPPIGRQPATSRLPSGRQPATNWPPAGYELATRDTRPVGGQSELVAHELNHLESDTDGRGPETLSREPSASMGHDRPREPWGHDLPRQPCRVRPRVSPGLATVAWYAAGDTAFDRLTVTLIP
jgi:hypothetical protein